MPRIDKVFTLTITPEQFVNSCDLTELGELELEIDRRRRDIYRKKQEEKENRLLGKN